MDWEKDHQVWAEIGGVLHLVGCTDTAASHENQGS